MKKISFKSLGVTEVEQLSRDQLKTVLGGSNGSGSGGQCYGCRTDSGNYSCWYSTGNPEELCQRVYPGQSGIIFTLIDCNGCTTHG
ncbi:hypothetical protein M8998_01480 [Sphingobacterium sp. lm-10]|uniref:hypothetical protein n=1 Tax=Sphingobacterium sp. lm-10 TaxID=2944904 RepID=UPI00201FF428|nr:hypothetical protein [Sphingobacterium sp. lm-10]MCL7986601.1 hypothetical protein [Sphingobacterium sp. lm-10]